MKSGFAAITFVPSCGFIIGVGAGGEIPEGAHPGLVKVVQFYWTGLVAEPLIFRPGPGKMLGFL